MSKRSSAIEALKHFAFALAIALPSPLPLTSPLPQPASPRMQFQVGNQGAAEHPKLLHFTTFFAIRVGASA
eukprot:13748711-Alexandrium_andersonii.AAC.1